MLRPREAGAHRMIAQSIAWAYAPGPRPYCEDHPLDLNAEGDRLVSVRGVESLERQVLGASPMDGLALRYGRLYGPGSGADAPPSPPSVHVDAAAYAALLAIDHASRGHSTSPISMPTCRPARRPPRLAGALTFDWI